MDIRYEKRLELIGALNYWVDKLNGVLDEEFMGSVEVVEIIKNVIRINEELKAV